MGGFAASDGVGWERSVRWPSRIGPKLLFAPREAFELVPKPNLHSTYALSQKTLNPKPKPQASNLVNPKPSIQEERAHQTEDSDDAASEAGRVSGLGVKGFRGKGFGV